MSFGAGGEASGVSWHTHGGGFSETFHGRKRWFLLPPQSPTFADITANPNRSVAEWATRDLPALRRSSAATPRTTTAGGAGSDDSDDEDDDGVRGDGDSPYSSSSSSSSSAAAAAASFLLPQECVIGPGELLYFPANWPHATLNLDAYTSFASTFLIDE